MKINHAASNVMDTVGVTENDCRKYITDIRKIQSYEDAIKQIAEDFYNENPCAFVAVCCGAVEAVYMADLSDLMVYSDDHFKLLEMVDKYDTPSVLAEHLMTSKEYEGIVAFCASIPYLTYSGL